MREIVVPTRASASRFNGATTSRSWNDAASAATCPRCLASMGPRPLGRGMQSRLDQAQIHVRASMGPRPLGRGMSCPYGHIRMLDCASIRPRPLGRGMCAPRRARSGPGSSFNGATTSRSWNGGGAVPRSAHDAGFNGATTSRSWNVRDQLEALADWAGLQWGHDLSVVECGETAQKLYAAEVASMGPRPLGRGMRTMAFTPAE